MKLDVFCNKSNKHSLLKILFVDIVCFFVITISLISFCYSYFSDKADVTGKVSTAMVSIDYRTNKDDPSSSSNEIYAQVNGGALTTLSSITTINPGDDIVIKGYAVNTSDVSVYTLAKLQVINYDYNSDIIDTETVWYNISSNTPVYIQQGVAKVTASVLNVGASQAINISYTFDEERYTNEYSSISVSLALYAHQKDYLNLSEDYINYPSDSAYATHYLLNRKRSLWQSEHNEIDGLTLSDLKTDSSGAYLINSCKDWMILKQNCNQDNNYCNNLKFKLNAYLDFDNTTTAKTIDTFKGSLDGQGYTISNWTGSMGLFNNIYGNVSNLGIDGTSISSSSIVGGLAANAYQSNIDRCFVIGSSVYDNSITNDISSSECVGGLIGSVAQGCSVSNCYAIVNISSTSTAGGIVGSALSNISNCYYMGSISNSTNAGLISGSSTADISNCIAISTTTNTIADTSNTITSCAYIFNNNFVATKVSLTTDSTVTLNTFKCIGLIRDIFSWDTNIWCDDIYQGANSNTSGLIGLRVFWGF